jgi:hypothetical protein
MKNKQLTVSILVVAMALGTAWAIRGRFGHEQGAAWAGVLGAVAIVLAAKRIDWYNNVFKIALAAAFGWGISGVVSYGVVVGYGRGVDFGNVFYGLMMLFIIGILYGLLGGGLVGLALIDSAANKVKWHRLITEMVAMGLLAYGILINQLEWLMTPPRSEMWAACLGASMAVVWYIVRHKYYGVVKVAISSALGAGFGFAFGNFLQVMGGISGFEFNFWNVMEYSIGFFGGGGMAYGVFTSQWPASDIKVRPHSNLIPILLVLFFVPFVVWDQSFVTDRFDFIPDTNTIFVFKLAAFVAISAAALLCVRENYSVNNGDQPSRDYGIARNFFIIYFALYILLSFLVTGIFTHPPEQYLYVLNFIAILWILPRLKGAFEPEILAPGRWVWLTFFSIIILGIFALIAANSHGQLPGSQIRF